ncbi:spore coat U domain-containing protein [Nitratireductor sp. L1-7-SE]|uniref:Spore coat U domain-containing protein n=2 Tax=Nitratireductor rhodophyticola TaxID=2854036 RepID=A0ABS7R815_9HYPH|nr:spore coat U domain-containing protein [Nitratireductor rhodophyticola]MBY8917086.1 spore coat U domain-containing protein [Nitratireductor rhodophyticola]MBY8920485.1 spore coat U domain-containing protein [Nitratireductor rhodophyticola]
MRTHFLFAMTALGVFLKTLEPASAATATGSMNVQIQIIAECLVTSATDLDFGTEGIIASNIDQTSTISVQCTDGTPYNVGLGAGAGSGATVTNRLMTGPASATIGYALYRDSGRTQNWGETVGTDTVAGTGNGNVQAITVYGRVPAQATPGVGTYTDSVTVTVTY